MFIITFDSRQQVNFPAHILANILYLTVTSKSYSYLIDGLGKEFVGFDHSPIYFDINLFRPPLLLRSTTFHTYENLNYEVFKTDFMNILDSLIHLPDNKLVNLMNESLRSLIDSHAL